jgi:Lsr2
VAREVVYTDDLDGTHGAEPVQFAWDGVTWEIDLAEPNRKKLEEALQPFLDKAHPAQVAQAKSARRVPGRHQQPVTGSTTAHRSTPAASTVAA